MKKYNVWILLAVIAVLFVFVPQTVIAQDEDPVPTPSDTELEAVTDDEVNEIARDMYCPICENTPLDQCGTVVCQDWRDEIRLLIAQGYSTDQIFEYFISLGGDRVVGAPPARGLNLIVYIVPPVVIAGGILYYIIWIRNAQKKGTEISEVVDPTAPDAEVDEYVAKLEEQLKKRE